jgi:5-histidylcysteine sulfoxide synthase/putative 4-mercaptohistidine N1-methyltranferase
MKREYITRNIALDSGDAELKRKEIKEYFNTTYELYEKLFELLASDEVFYEQPEALRHPLIFYFGHTATFFINKLNVSKIYTKRVNDSFESIFAIGVDEMSWDDLNPNNYEWPSIESVRAYRAEVKDIVNNIIDSMDISLAIGWESPWWVIMMGIEHERIHLETSSVLIRQLDIMHVVQQHPLWSICEEFSTQEYPQNRLLSVEAKEIVLGRYRSNPRYYGWDNEFGEEKFAVAAFEASEFLVSNGEFLEFVKDGGYREESYWESEGLEWREYKGAEHPTFWIKRDGRYFYRALNKELPLPLNFPVDVNYHEAKAFCNWKSAKEGRSFDLPNEAQWHSLRIESGVKDEPQWGEVANANINLEHFASACAVDRFKHGKFFDVIGNVWQWTKTSIYPYNGFEVHPYYDDFSVPTFDRRHNIIKGGSFISTGNEALAQSRYAFRKHFFQHAGFRYIVSQKEDESQKDIYERDSAVNQYIEFHYGQSYFGVPNFPETLAKKVLAYTKNRGKALDIGCSVGRASFELAKEFNEVWGLDFSARFIGVATMLQESGEVFYEIPVEGDLKENRVFALESIGVSAESTKRCRFYQADASNLKPIYSGYDLVLALNLIDRLYDPQKFLDDIVARVNSGGVLMLASPYSWSEEFTPKERWIGGYYCNGKAVQTASRLKDILASSFEFLDEFKEAFVIKESAHKFQHTLSNVQVWRKR